MFPSLKLSIQERPSIAGAVAVPTGGVGAGEGQTQVGSIDSKIVHRWTRVMVPLLFVILFKLK